MTKIKICGLRRPEDITYANRLMPDAIGFVFWEKSRRNLSPEQAGALREQLNPAIRAVGVFVDTPWEEIRDLLDNGVIDIAQLHGRETEEDVRRLKAASQKPVLKAVQVRSRRDIEAWRDSEADCLLFDSGMGSGREFDWRLLADVKRKFFLAGGLNGDNLGQVLEQVQPYGVDLSSGVETDGIKDFQKMKKVMDILRDWNERAGRKQEPAEKREK